MTYRLHREMQVQQPLEKTFEFFSRPENLARITPPWMGFRMTSPPPIRMQCGTLLAYTLKVRGWPLHWLTKIESWNPPFDFIDLQSSGPYKLWRHTHRFREIEGGTRISDTVEYELPFGILGRLAHPLVVRDLARIFDYRAEQVRRILG